MRKVRVLCAAMLCALAVCVAAVVSAQELSDYSRLFGVLQSTDGESDVNLREAPSMDAPLVGVYRCGVRAQAVKEKDGWLLVEVGGDGIGCLRGYVLEKYFKPAYSVEYESGFPVMRLSDAQPTWDWAVYPEEKEPQPARIEANGTFTLGTSGWPQLCAGTLCVVLGEVEDGVWSHVQIGFDQVGFVKTQALEPTGLTSLSDARLPRAGIAVAHPGTPYAMPVYRYTDDSKALSPTLYEGDTLEYITQVGDWVQVSISNYMECAFVPAQYLTLYPYASLYAPENTFSEGTHTIETPGLYTFSCVGSGRLEIETPGGTRVYESGGMYSMYLPQGARVTVEDGILSGVSRDAKIEDLSEDGVGAWDESRGNGRYLGGVQLAADLWREGNYVVTVEDGKKRGWFRIESIDQDAGVTPPGEWVEVEAGGIVQITLYHGQFIELRDARLAYFSGNG